MSRHEKQASRPGLARITLRFAVVAAACAAAAAACVVAAVAAAPGATREEAEPPSAAVDPPARATPVYILIKVDDLRKSGKTVHPRWQKLADFLKERKIKAGIGIICDSLEGDSPEYFRWIKEQKASGLIEFWNHGYDHKQWTENGKTVQEFSGTPYAFQKEHLRNANQLAKEKLGFTLPAFGAPFNGVDANTRRALMDDPDTKIWLYGDMKNPSGKLVLERIGPVNIENPLFKPSVEKFISGYRRYPNRPYFVIQGHPAQWDDAGFAEFVKIVDFLQSEGAIFVTPSEYAAIVARQNALSSSGKTAP